MGSLVENILRQKLNEIGMPSLRMPVNIELSDEELNSLKQISWENISVSNGGDDGHSIIHLDIRIPNVIQTDVSKGIIVDIQLIKDTLYQVHINLCRGLQRLGLAPKIYKAIIMEYGHLYSGIGRRQNPAVSHIWDILRADGDVKCYDNELGTLCISKDNPKAEELLKFFNQ